MRAHVLCSAHATSWIQCNNTLTICPSLLLAAAGEDMWHAYNLIREGDQVTATTFRKVQQETSKGSDSERVKIRLTIQVEHVDFDPDGEGGGQCA